jgi:DNA-binding LacI/PurR family transcriptional regulator
MDDVLTTVALPFYEIGKSSVIQLLDIHDNGMNENNREVKVATQMIWKKSLGKANGK